MQELPFLREQPVPFYNIPQVCHKGLVDETKN